MLILNVQNYLFIYYIFICVGFKDYIPKRAFKTNQHMRPEKWAFKQSSPIAATVHSLPTVAIFKFEPMLIPVGKTKRKLPSLSLLSLSLSLSLVIFMEETLSSSSIARSVWMDDGLSNLKASSSDLQGVPDEGDSIQDCFDSMLCFPGSRLVLSGLRDADCRGFFLLFPLIFRFSSCLGGFYGWGHVNLGFSW